MGLKPEMRKQWKGVLEAYFRDLTESHVFMKFRGTMESPGMIHVFSWNLTCCQDWL